MKTVKKICQINRIRIVENLCEPFPQQILCKAPDGRVLERFVSVQAAKDWAGLTLDFVAKPGQRSGVCLMAWAKPYIGLPEAHTKKICSGIESRTPYEIYIDAGGPNREEPFSIDPAKLLISVNGRVWQIPVSDFGKQLAGVRA